MEEILKEILESIKEQKKTKKITFSIQEAALYMGIAHDKLRELVNRKDTDFPFFKVGSRTVIDKRALDIWIEKITQEHRVL